VFIETLGALVLGVHHNCRGIDLAAYPKAPMEGAEKQKRLKPPAAIVLADGKPPEECRGNMGIPRESLCHVWRQFA